MPKFKVCVQQYVERVAVIEVEADDADDARREASYIWDTNLYSTIEWQEGDDARDVESYAVLDESGNVVWER